MRKKRKSESAKPEKKSRAKYACPPVLAACIHWANYLKPDIPLPAIDNNFVFYDEVAKKLEAVSSEENTLPFYELYKEDIDKMNVWELWHSSDARIYTEFLSHIATLAAEKIGKAFSATESSIFGDDDFVAAFLNIYTSYRADILTTIEFAKALNEIRKGETEKSTWSSLLTAIRKIKYNRLRICEVCERIFWANNKNSETHSPQCANILRVRKHRQLSDEEKEARKAQRKANERIVKARKARKTKKEK